MLTARVAASVEDVPEEQLAHVGDILKGVDSHVLKDLESPACRDGLAKESEDALLCL